MAAIGPLTVIEIFFSLAPPECRFQASPCDLRAEIGNRKGSGQILDTNMVEWATVRYSTGDFWVVGLLTPKRKSTPKDDAARFRGRLETPEAEDVHEGGAGGRRAGSAPASRFLEAR
jgi:hypothetical protein